MMTNNPKNKTALEFLVESPYENISHSILNQIYF